MDTGKDLLPVVYYSGGILFEELWDGSVKAIGRAYQWLMAFIGKHIKI